MILIGETKEIKYKNELSFANYRQPGEGSVGVGEDWQGTIMGYLTNVKRGETVFPSQD